MKKYIYYILVISILIIACEDVINTESNLNKRIEVKKSIEFTNDTLKENYIKVTPTDMGLIKMYGSKTIRIDIKNCSDKNSFTFNSISFKSNNSIPKEHYSFSTYIIGKIPITINQNTYLPTDSVCVYVQFIANMKTNTVYDTLIINNSDKLLFPVKIDIE